MFGMQMSRAGRHLLPEADMLVPVPLHSARLIKRRFNQSALLAREVSRFHDLEVETESLIRIKKTPSQGGKSTLGRRRNVAGAFKLRRTDRVKGKTIILIDDVFTTGATLEACARTLRKGGAERIYAITLARVVKGQVIPK